VIGGYTQPGGERKYMGALLVGVHENGKLKFAGRVGTGFSEKLLKSLSVELNKIAVKACPFYELPATGRGLDPGLPAAEMKHCIWVNPSMVCEVKFTEWTRDDRLRQPVFLGIREDKNASEVVRLGRRLAMPKRCHGIGTVRLWPLRRKGPELLLGTSTAIELQRSCTSLKNRFCAENN
jgi:ATP-dependent DNA ligase